MTHRLEVAHGIDALRSGHEWNELVASSAHASFFSSAEWIVAWWHDLVGEPELAVATVLDGDSIVAGAALARVRTPLYARLGMSVTTVVNAGSGVGAADHGGFPAVAGATPDALGVLWDWARDWHGDDPLVLRSLSPDAAITAQVAASLPAVDVQLCPRAVVPVGSDYNTIVAGWTKNRRKSIGKKVRAFASRGGTFEWVDEPARILELLPTLFDLHRTRRDDLGRSSRFGHDDASRRFHHRLVAASVPARGCWLQLATLDGAVVGALYGFRFDDVYSVYQSGWDPVVGDLSLGLVQYATAFRHVVEHGGRVFDMCRGDDPYKLRFATEVSRELTYARTAGIKGRLLGQRFRFDAARRARRRASTEREGVDVSELVGDGSG